MAAVIFSVFIVALPVSIATQITLVVYQMKNRRCNVQGQSVASTSLFFSYSVSQLLFTGIVESSMTERKSFVYIA